MLYRVVLGSLVVAGTAHADPTVAPPLDGVAATTPSVAEGPEHRVDAVLGTGGAGARYTLVGERAYLELQAFGESGRQGAMAKLGLGRFAAFGIEHELVTGVGLIDASAESDSLPGQPDPMTTHTTLAGTRGQHRFLSAYINDTVRFIRGLDVTGGLVVEQWQNLGGDSTIKYGSGPPMDPDTPDFGYMLAPTVSVTAHVSDRVALVAQTYRGVRELGPTITAGRITARARAFTSDAGTGTAAEVSVQPVAPLIATVGYTRSTDEKAAAAAVTYTDVRVASLTARVDTIQRIDALAVRRLHGGVSGFVGVDNLLDRRAADTSRRLIMVGVRGTFTR